mmetsp:Transcript_70992/g.123131  ORF Transcript_70992/g.123131 Transcript_70992/m.123131 type:complete len:215 (-) Transcript_70992:19-663(-)
MHTAATPGQCWGNVANKPENYITWGGSLMPPIESIEPRVRREFLNRFYLPRLQEEHHAYEVLKRTAEKGLCTDSELKHPSALSSRRRAHAGFPSPPMAGSRSHATGHRQTPLLSCSLSEPNVTSVRQRGGLGVATEDGRYGQLWLPRRANQQQPSGYLAGPRHMWGPVAHALHAQQRVPTSQTIRSSSSSQCAPAGRGSSSIRFRESSRTASAH